MWEDQAVSWYAPQSSLSYTISHSQSKSFTIMGGIHLSCTSRLGVHWRLTGVGGVCFTTLPGYIFLIYEGERGKHVWVGGGYVTTFFTNVITLLLVCSRRDNLLWPISSSLHLPVDGSNENLSHSCSYHLTNGGMLARLVYLWTLNLS